MALSAVPAVAKTLVLTGRLSSEVTVTQRITFGADRELSRLTYRFPLPAAVRGASVKQSLADHHISFRPEPVSVTDETDSYGNRYKKVAWKDVPADATATIVFTADVDAALDPLAKSAPFPLPQVPKEERIYLKPSKLVQSDNPQIVAKAEELTADARTEADAVDSVLNFVSDHIHYVTPPTSYDALFGFTSGTGNCQNFAHLSAALLRASGIPARVAVGLTLKEKWKIPLDDQGSYLVQGMGEGLHAWLEVYFPGAGWLPYDPQQSKQFTSTRHIKYAHGIECGDIGNAWWSAAPVLPRYDSILSTSFSRDVIDLSLKGSGTEPRSYLMSREMVAAATEPVPVPPAPEPVPLPSPPVKPVKDLTPPVPPAPAPVPKPTLDKPKPLPAPKPLPTPVVKPKDELPKPLPTPVVKPKPPKKPLGPPPLHPDPDGTVVFGNMRFPSTLALYTTNGGRGEVTLERETAEYVTSSSVYAQAFAVDRPVRLSQVSLAMKKFGGDGMVYVDVVADDNGKPGLSGVRSRMVSLEKVKRSTGYAWVDFPVSDSATLAAGKYWIVLRRSGEAIMNWFYTPGKPYGGPDDTRSTARGWRWEDILTYDFVFKVAGGVVQ